MSGLPTAELMAKLVSGVTSTMFGISFRVANHSFAHEQRCKSGMLVICGGAPVAVMMSSNQTGCAHLGSAMFSCPVEDVDSSMMEDSLRELLNMTGGQLARALKLDAPIGLPHILDSSSQPHGSDGWLCVYLRSPSIELEVCLSNNPKDWANDKTLRGVTPTEVAA